MDDRCLATISTGSVTWVKAFIETAADKQAAAKNVLMRVILIVIISITALLLKT